jgi:transcriptional regulator of acetoin/glycerol metabolism
MSRRRTSHIEDVFKVAEGRNDAQHDSIISESWRRCVSDHQLDPALPPNVYVHTQQQIQERRGELESFLRTARFGLENLYQQVAGLGYVLLLTDANGVTIDFIGDPTFDNQLRKAGLYLGSLWSEPTAGTNGVGTCIATRRGLVVHQAEHFSSNNIDLTCTAAPIFSPDGDLAAVLDISALRSPEAKESQHLALTLVTSYAHRIETANLLNAYRSSWVLKLSKSPEFLCVDPEYVVALDNNGAIAAFNHKAGMMLRSELGLLSEANLLGLRFEDVFDCKLSSLGAFVRPDSGDGAAIRLAKSGGTLFLYAHAPRHKPSVQGGAADQKLAKPLRDLTGGDKTVMALLKRVEKLASTPVSLLIRGETGSGKERLAKAIHEVSRRGRFVPVNCAAIPETLIESELFGYEPGAFTGARAKGKEGLISQANGGTLFLDEIGDMPIQLQTRLLRVLAEREIVPLGGSKPIPLDIRVIAATHRDLTTAIKNGEFREDLFYRLNGFDFTLPPLRERTDLEWLIERIIESKIPDGSRRPRFTEQALHILRNHDWPGNIRELINVVELAVAVSNDSEVTEEDLPDSILNRVRNASSPAGAPVPSDDISESEVARLKDCLVRRQWNVSQVARDLDLDRTTIHRRMKRFGIVPPNKEGE